jgi:hypothetical protein
LSIHSTDVYDVASGGPLGYFDVAFDPATHRACGYSNAVGPDIVVRRPTWFQCAGDVSHVVQAFYEIVRDTGHVD